MRPSIRIICWKLSGYQIPHFRPDNPDFRYQILSGYPSLARAKNIFEYFKGQGPGNQIGCLL